MKKTLSTAFMVAALALTAACGGGADRPSANELSKSLTGEGSVFGSSFPKESADCFAKVLVDSDLSDKTLNAIVEGDKDYKGSKDEEKALGSLTGKLASECAPKS